MLKRDIEDLIKSMQQDFAQNYQDAGLGARLKALLDLQHILRSQTLPPDQIQAVRRQVTEVQENQRRAAQAAFVPRSVPTPQQFPPPQSSIPAQASYAPPPPANQPPSTNLLAGLLASVERNRHTPVPSGDVYSPKPSSAVPVSIPHSTPLGGVVEENPVIARLRASGLLSQAGTPNPIVATPVSSASGPAPSAPAQVSTNLSELLRKVATKPRKEVELTSASLKVYVHISPRKSKTVDRA